MTHVLHSKYIIFALYPTSINSLHTKQWTVFQTCWFLWFIFFRPLSCHFFWRLSDWKHGQPSQAFHLRWQWCQETQQLCTSELPVIHKGKNQNQIGQLNISSCLILTLLHLIHVTDLLKPLSLSHIYIFFFKSSMVKSKRRDCQNEYHIPIFFIRFIHDLVYITAHALKTVLLGEK